MLGVNLLEVIMVKKLSYLVSVSVLASSLWSSASHAVFEDELRDVINEFRIQQRSQPVQQVAFPSLPSDEEPYSYWNMISSVGNTVSYLFSPLVSGTGHSLRYMGDSLREDSFVGDVLANNAISLAGTVQYGGVSATGLINQVKADEGALKSLRKTGGNVLRSVGASMVGETPTLERTMRQFWIDKRLGDDPEEVFISTACALYRSQELKGADEIRLAYRKFIGAWNGSSYTAPSSNPEQNVEYFLKGIIRGFVMNSQVMSDFQVIAPQMVALGITYDNLPVTKAITADKVIPDGQARGQLAPVDLQGKIDEARQNEFMKFIQATYEIESLKKQANHARMVSLQSPLALPSSAPSSLPAIEYQKPHDDINDSVD
jgi:hypothetical protein